jgi:molybdopterin-containing oxidoreductase family membrane subunit
VNLVVVSDLAISLVPGWRSAVIPPYHALSGLEAGVATTLLSLAGLRRFGRLQAYIGLDPFWGAAKLLLPLALLFFYFTWAELLTNWYGRTPEEQQLLTLFMFGPYLWLFVLSFGLNFVLPFLLLIWNPIRVSIAGPTAVSVLVVLGNFVDRVRIYVPSWSVAGPVGQSIEQIPPAHYPQPADVLIVLGAIALAVLLYLLALRLIPAISVWEYKQGLLLSGERAFVRTDLRVIAKPR